ncbi:hypothetical protein [Anditalea andensis]|uniref:Uncharacterized protein n=1 Tax=Anditalea andensis TaxID=1048983 RepID=A0A074L2P4_9BACT|nr:hypothetical protein [Anditalea andensis]KEO74103.1 hypothetical protein EL17_08130 [Anditalea andensis]
MIEINFIGLAISMVLLFAFMTPIILNIRKNNKTQKALLLQMENAFLKHGLKVHKIESWRHRYAIAIDHEARKLIFINTGSEPQEIFIDLNEVNQVIIHENHHLNGTGKESYKVIDRLDLILLGAKQERYKLSFYDSEVFSDVQNEKPLLDEWYAHIKTIIQNRPVQKAAVLA